MKFKDKNDSIRKVSLIDDLSMGISYNTAGPVTVRNGRMAVSVVGRDMVRRSVGP